MIFFLAAHVSNQEWMAKCHGLKFVLGHFSALCGPQHRAFHDLFPSILGREENRGKDQNSIWGGEIEKNIIIFHKRVLSASFSAPGLPSCCSARNLVSRALSRTASPLLWNTRYVARPILLAIR